MQVIKKKRKKKKTLIIQFEFEKHDYKQKV